MSEFVNYKKRGVTLPSGCKDLLDVLKLQPGVTPHLRDVVIAPGVISGGKHTGKLPELENFCRNAFASKSANMVLQLSSTDEALSVIFCRWPRVEFAAVTFRSNKLWESSCRKLFDRHGLEPPKNFQWPKVAGVKVAPILADSVFYKLIPTPSDALRFSAIARDIFESLLKLTEDDVLQFHQMLY
jgi:hypothetical protein